MDGSGTLIEEKESGARGRSEVEEEEEAEKHR